MLGACGAWKSWHVADSGCDLPGLERLEGRQLQALAGDVALNLSHFHQILIISHRFSMLLTPFSKI